MTIPATDMPAMNANARHQPVQRRVAIQQIGTIADQSIDTGRSRMYHSFSVVPKATRAMAKPIP